MSHDQIVRLERSEGQYLDFIFLSGLPHSTRVRANTHSSLQPYVYLNVTFIDGYEF